ncbi:related to Cytochrome P450 [Sporisorium reilianum SRZ2]|uniref:Related to Cytochrome P450 n=1 Tax=Sporisorium reilianum (strain SRZ2) TaxID=999809 RepID=E6ZQZ6_SPORE|nr:related to Cytochrome P450 [Sporisorium reilianum SRZ2]
MLHLAPRFVWLCILSSASHHLVFRRVELWPFQLVMLASVLFILDVSLRHCIDDTLISLDALKRASIDLTVWTWGVLFSIAVYRLFLHRLRRFPGPTSWALSKFAFLVTDIKGLRSRAVEEAHRKYGDVVRTSPRELSINAVSVIVPIMGAKSTFWRGPWYTASAGSRSPHAPRNLHAVLIESDHAARRKSWEVAFSAKALKSYETILIDVLDTMVDQLEQRARRRETINIDDHCSLYAFDVMGQAGFGAELGLLNHGQLTPMIQALESFMSFVQLVGNLPYLVEILGLLPNPMAEFDKYINQIVAERKARKDPRPDVMGHLLHDVGHASSSGDSKRKDAEAASDARLIVVAGSDTASTTLGIAVFFLIENPPILADLRQELLDVLDDDPSLLTDLSRMDDKTCPLLNAVINESLRLFPPVPTGLQRESPTAAMIDVHGSKVVIPANTVVTLPIWSIQRDDRNFSPEPLQFRPERWLCPEKEDRFNRAAFMPFSFGKTSCVGKALAYMELRLVLANLVRRFDFVPTEKYDAQKFQDGLMDAFVIRRNHKLPVTVHIRDQVGP